MDKEKMVIMENTEGLVGEFHESLMNMIKTGYCLDEVPAEEELRLAFASLFGNGVTHDLNDINVLRAVAIVREWYHRMESLMAKLGE